MTTLHMTTGRFSLLRSLLLADWMTLANATCGSASVFLAIARATNGQQELALAGFAPLLLAAVCDTFDGRAASRSGSASALGKELDSLADAISFGIAPAALAFASGVTGMIGVTGLLFFMACGLCRLARYNATADELARVTGKVAYFEGTPITFGLAPLAIVLALDATGHLLPPMPFASALLFVVSGCAMVSKTIRVPKL